MEEMVTIWLPSQVCISLISIYISTYIYLSIFQYYTNNHSSSYKYKYISISTGTNAIFRLPPIHTVGGVPYGSLTEDAHTAIRLHKFGYKSMYVPDKLAVGIAPVTVANSLQQRGRWCKGSVQLSFLYLFGGIIKDKDKPKWAKPNPFPLETRVSIGPIYMYIYASNHDDNTSIQ